MFVEITVTSEEMFPSSGFSSTVMVDFMEKPWTTGGDASIVTPLDEELVETPAALIAVTVTK
jgi:hypothetical protein